MLVGLGPSVGEAVGVTLGVGIGVPVGGGVDVGGWGGAAVSVRETYVDIESREGSWAIRVHATNWTLQRSPHKIRNI